MGLAAARGESVDAGKTDAPLIHYEMLRLQGIKGRPAFNPMDPWAPATGKQRLQLRWGRAGTALRWSPPHSCGPSHTMG